MSFLVRTVEVENESYMYMHLNGQEFMQYGGFSSPAPFQFLPCTFEKVYEVPDEGESITITVIECGQYPVTVRNFVLTAKRI